MTTLSIYKSTSFITLYSTASNACSKIFGPHILWAPLFEACQNDFLLSTWRIQTHFGGNLIQLGCNKNCELEKGNTIIQQCQALKKISFFREKINVLLQCCITIQKSFQTWSGLNQIFYKSVLLVLLLQGFLIERKSTPNKKKIPYICLHM